MENAFLALKNDVKKLQTKNEIQEKVNKEAILKCQSEINFLKSNIKTKDESNQVKSVFIYSYFCFILIIRIFYSIIKSLKMELKNIALGSSGHGLPKIFEAKNILFRIMWTTFYISAIVCFLVFMNLNLSNYNKNDVVTNIKSYTADSLEFPPITVCFEKIISETSKKYFHFYRQPCELDAFCCRYADLQVD